jgi:hypothetical protein
MITAILTAYERPETLPLQVQLLRNQSVPPHDIWLWVNKPDKSVTELHIPSGIKVVKSDHNFSYYSRYALALLARTKYVAVIDDDMFPGEGWFQNCIESIGAYPGIYGARGVILKDKYYQGNKGYGWNENRLDTVKQVDLVGQSVFMCREHLPYMFYESPTIYPNGEDITLAFMAQKHGDLRCFVPPQPEGKPEMWGSTDGEWTAVNASSNSKHHITERNALCREYHEQGWQTLWRRRRDGKI